MKLLSIHKLTRPVITTGHFFEIACFLFIIACNPSDKNTTPQILLEGETMGTTYHIKICGEGDNKSLQLEIDSILVEFSRALSTYDPSSLISRFNNNLMGIEAMKNIQDPIAKSNLNHFLKVCYRSFDVYQASSGAFDPAAGPLFKIWGFAENEIVKIPEQSAIDSLLLFSHFDMLEFIDGFPVKKDLRLQLNFNAIAPGYATDVVAGWLEDRGYKNYMVEIGGEINCAGTNTEGNPWQIGINKPEENAGKEDIKVRVALSNQALATSGNYRNFYFKDGKRYAHTIDPKNGHPTENELLSATIMAPDCMTADAYATACMVLGKNGCLDLVKGDTTLKVFLIYSDSSGLVNTAFSPGVEKIILP
jgi:thiamine biosynthesis lipoprotein